MNLFLQGTIKVDWGDYRHKDKNINKRILLKKTRSIRDVRYYYKEGRWEANIRKREWDEGIFLMGVDYR